MKALCIPLMITLFLCGCGPAFLAGATDKPVTMADIVGTWQYNDLCHKQKVTIDFKEEPAGSGSGTFTQTFRDSSGAVVTNSGSWTLNAPSVFIEDVIVGIGEARPESVTSSWKFVDGFEKAQPVVLFGGDCADPDHWERMEKLR